MMKRVIAAAFAAVMAASLMTGCVKVVPIGGEGELTGEVEFNAADSVDTLWEEAVKEVNDNAQDLAEILNAGGDDVTTVGDQFGGVKKEDNAKGFSYMIKAEGAKITAIDKEAFYKTMELEIPGYTGSVKVVCEIGKYKSTALRDSLSAISFKDFKNQTEWSQIGKSLQKKIDAEVVTPVFDSLDAGATIDITGCFTADKKDSISISPVSITVK